MLKNLASRFRGDDLSHPLASNSGIEGILAGVPRNIPERTLFDLDQWMAESEHAAGKVSPSRLLESVSRLDEEAVPVIGDCLSRYFDPRGRDHLAEQYWQTMIGHCRIATAAYLRYLQQTLKPIAEINAADRKQMAPAALRAMYWLMREKALLRIRYRAPDAAWWQKVHDLLARSHACGVAAMRLRVFPKVGEETSVWQEYAQGLYFELAPVGSLSPDNIETLDRILRIIAPAFQLKVDCAGCDYSVDLTGTVGPVKIEPGSTQGPQWRHLSPLSAYNLLLRLAGQVKAAKALPDWLADAPADVENVEAMLRTLILHWSKQPPKRRGHRQPRHDELLVVHGFALARRMLACSDFARSGRSLQYDSDLVLAHRNRLESHFTTEEHHRREVEIAQEQAAITPLEVLHKLELGGDRAMMEKWALSDISGVGLGAHIPHLRAVHGVGNLVGFRFANEVDWRLGVIRRIGHTDEGKISVGLESLPNGPAVCAQAKPATPAGKTAWHEIEGSGLGYLDALMVSPEGNELVLPAGAFGPKLPVELRVAGRERHILLTELIEHGKDF
ncbi:MAG TPA: hypothetical protein VMB75_00490, partial [Rhodocyclaceae bacterium]|nr:hypothetical protein [Rhodocyclaceae bacterium]